MNKLLLLGLFSSLLLGCLSQAAQPTKADLNFNGQLSYFCQPQDSVVCYVIDEGTTEQTMSCIQNETLMKKYCEGGING